jgi:Ca2+-transporting ATPase
MRIPARELVAGDIVLLQEGDRTPADGTLIAAHGLAADESLMTGESAPVDKLAGEAVPPPEHGLTPADFALGGSVIVKGEGVMRVTATGPRSRLGQIGVAIAGAAFEPPRLTVQLRRIVRLFAAGAIAASLAMFVGAGLSGGDWMWALLLGLALAISLVPEEIPLVAAVFTVVGALRIARAGVLARQAGAIETLGETTVLCLDKTGTLTQNRMALAGAWTPGGGFFETCDPDRSEDCAALLCAARDACASVSRDPMEQAILAAAPAHAGPAPGLKRSWPFTREMMAMANLHRAPDGEHCL